MKKLLLLILLGSLAWYAWGSFSFTPHDARESFQSSPLTVTIDLNGAKLSFRNQKAETVKSFLEEVGFKLHAEDQIFPDGESKLSPGMTIIFQPARSVRLMVDSRDETFLTTEKTTLDILNSRGIVLDEDDMVEPLREKTVSEKTKIVVTRVEIKEETKDASIAFTTKTVEDDELSWRKKTVTQKGEKGIRRTTYRVSYHDGKEVNRRTLKTEVVKEPVQEIVTQGTYVKTGKSHRGAASWYAWTGTMAAANPWLPKGSYVRVTNMANGKSVIVVINDRGPFVPGRIIDLDKVAFEKIASIGAGVIDVKMEEITN